MGHGVFEVGGRRVFALALAAAMLLAGSTRALAVSGDSAPAPAADEIIVEVGPFKATAADITAEFNNAPPPLVADVQRSANSGRIQAVEWYARLLYDSVAKQDGLYQRRPGLAAFADQRRRSVVGKAYVDDFIATNYQPSPVEMESLYKLEGKTICDVPATYHLARIGVVTGKYASDVEKAEAQKRLAAIQKRLADGEDFAKVADEASDIAGRARGGSLGWVPAADLEKAPEAEPIRALEVGQTTAPIETRHGTMIFRLVEREDARVRSFEDCRTLLQENLEKSFRREIARQRIDDLAARLGARMNMDAVIAAIRAVKLPDNWQDTWKPEKE